MIEEPAVAPKRGRGRPRKIQAAPPPPPAPIPVAAIIERTPEERIRLDADAARKREQRAEVRTKKQMSEVETIQDLWNMNRANLKPEQRAEFEARTDRVLDLEMWVRDVINGTNLPPDDEDYVSFEDGRPAVEAHVKENGLTLIEVTLLGDFWTEPNLYARFKHREDAASTFACYGYLTGIPEHLYEQWREFCAAKDSKPPVTLNTSGYCYMRCSTSLCNSHPIVMSLEDARDYERKNIPYRCAHCILAGAAPRELYKSMTSPDSSVFDGYGRVRTDG